MRKGMLLEGKAVFSIMDLNNPVILFEPDRWMVWLPLVPWFLGATTIDTNEDRCNKIAKKKGLMLDGNYIIKHGRTSYW